MARVDADPVALEVSRMFDASPEAVFDAWFGEHWAKWVAPRGGVCTILPVGRSDVRRYRIIITMLTFRVVEVLVELREITKPSRLDLTWRAENERATRITIGFRPEGTGTMMTFRQEGLSSAAEWANYLHWWEGQHGSFDQLADYLTRTKLRTR